MSYNGRKQIETEYEWTIVRQEDDRSYTVRKANEHVLHNFGTGVDAFMQATGHANGISQWVDVKCDDPRE